MKELIEKLFTEFGFFTEDSEQDVRFYQKKSTDQISYYLVHFIAVQDLVNYVPELAMQPVFELLDQKKKLFKDLEKNASLLVCVLCDNLQSDCLSNKNSMMKIEEDEFWFKKYLLPYTLNGVAAISVEGETVLSTINSLVMNDHSFTLFNENIYINESYFLAMQLFIKIPFMSVSAARNQPFITIESMLENTLSKSELNFMYGKIVPHEHDQSAWDNLKVQAMNPKDDTFNDFLLKFEDDAEA